MSKKHLLIIALILVNCFLLSACTPQTSTQVCGVSDEGEAVTEGPFLTNPRFEPLHSMGLVASDNYWGIPNERFAVKYDQFTIHLTDAEVNCDYTLEDLPAGCRRCDFCDNRSCGLVPVYTTESIKPVLAIFEGSMLTASPTTTEPLIHSDGCSLNWTEQSRKIITVTKNTTYEIRDAETISCDPDFQKRKTLASFTVKVINGGAQNADFGMTPKSEMSQPQIAFYSWTTESRTELDPNTDSLRERWKENFNPLLKVTKVKVVQALKGDDNLDDNPPLIPTRLVFVQGYNQGISLFDQDDLFCSPMADGTFDFAACRQDVTPTYLKTNLLGRLTWFAEFNPTAGATVPAFNPETEEIKIVFTVSN